GGSFRLRKEKARRTSVPRAFFLSLQCFLSLLILRRELGAHDVYPSFRGVTCRGRATALRADRRAGAGGATCRDLPHAGIAGGGTGHTDRASGTAGRADP